MLQQELKRRIGSFLAFERDRFKRRSKYRGLKIDVPPSPEVLRSLKRDGFAIMPNAVDPGLLRQISAEMEAHINAGRCLIQAFKDSARPPGDVGKPKVFLSREEILQGQEFFRHHTNNIAIAEPLLNCPSVAKVALLELLIDIASNYLGCLPALGGLNLRKSFANGLSEFDTNYFHSDPNSPKFLKFFFYLHDVDEGGGPFCYIRGSHRKKFHGWRAKYRWTFDEMAQVYGTGNILNLTAHLGDLVMADTTGFHRGTKVQRTDRTLLTLNYVIHQEFGGRQAPFKIQAKDYERLSPKQRAAADFLAVVTDQTISNQLQQQPEDAYAPA